MARMGMLVIAPDGFAYPKNTPMGKLRHKDIQPLKLATDNVDYWAGDLIYCSDASGADTYSTKADSVLHDPDRYRQLYERCYQLRRSELHFIIGRLPPFIKTRGFFLAGTSEGAMSVARFDDQRYGEMVCGRIINSWSIEYNYFTPTPEAGRLGGQMDVPTLNIIGTKDPFFGATNSVARSVVDDVVAGYGDKTLTGNGYETMVEQGVYFGLVCVLEDGVHSPCDTHDNFLRLLFDHFFARPASIWKLAEIWRNNPVLEDLVRVEQTSLGDSAARSGVTRAFVPLPKFPNKWPLHDFLISMETAGYKKESAELLAAMDKELKERVETHKATQSLVEEVHNNVAKEGGFKASPPVETFYAYDAICTCASSTLRSTGNTCS